MHDSKFKQQLVILVMSKINIDRFSIYNHTSVTLNNMHNVYTDSGLVKVYLTPNFLFAKLKYPCSFSCSAKKKIDLVKYSFFGALLKFQKSRQNGAVFGSLLSSTRHGSSHVA